MRKLELLAPAKNLECGIAAIDSGADAIYIGASKFGARQAVGNSIEDIGKLCRYAHRFGCKVYVTVNTIIFDNELDDTQRLIHQIAQAGADAILVQDMGLLKLELPEGIELHASTQTDNRTAEKVKWLAGKGFSRVVLARELTLQEIREIHERVPETELEVFVHGALCVSYSGVCYASEYCFGRSANRGACAQFCRMKFNLTDAVGNTIEENAHLLSLKDMCRIESLERLADAGITSFKIEGRLKDINYVRNVTSAYSKKLDEIIKLRPKEYRRASEGVCTTSFEPNLKKTFNRGFTEYFLDGRKRDLASFYTPKAMGEYVGKVKEIRGNSFNVAGTATFANGDGLCFINANNELEGFRINRAEGNRLFPLELPRNLRRGTALYRNSDQQFEKMLNADKGQRKLPVAVSLTADNEGLTLRIKLKGSDREVNIRQGIKLEKAQKSQEENIKRQLAKLGNTMFTADGVELSPVAFPWFVPNSTLSELRREAVERLEKDIDESGKNHQATLNEPTAGNGAAKDKAAEENATQPRPSAYPAGYMYNIANHLAKEFYKEEGLNDLRPAFETEKPSTPLIMQCRYCLRHEMGACKKRDKDALKLKEPLRLELADGRTFRLEFDCLHCLMNIYADK